MAPAERVPDLDLVRKKTLLVASNISDSWSSIASSTDQTGLQELRLLLAGQDGMLCDLLDEERAIIEDTTIFVKSVGLSTLYCTSYLLTCLES